LVGKEFEWLFLSVIIQMFKRLHSLKAVNVVNQIRGQSYMCCLEASLYRRSPVCVMWGNATKVLCLPHRTHSYANKIAERKHQRYLSGDISKMDIPQCCDTTITFCIECGLGSVKQSAREIRKTFTFRGDSGSSRINKSISGHNVGNANSSAKLLEHAKFC
jgi:hypothetical protein